MISIIPVVTMPHTGTQTLIKTIDPVGTDKLQKLWENNELTIEEFKKIEYNYILLECLSSDWKEFKDLGKSLTDHYTMDSNKKNIVYGHIFPHNKKATFVDSLACIKELGEYTQLLMSMRDPLLSILSTLIRDKNKREVVRRGKKHSTIAEAGGPLAPMADWIRHNMNQELFGQKDPRNIKMDTKEALLDLARERLPKNVRIKDIRFENISGAILGARTGKQFNIKGSSPETKANPYTCVYKCISCHKDTANPKFCSQSCEESYNNKGAKNMSDFLTKQTNTGRKEKIPGSEHISASNYEIRGQIFMWELWAKHIHELDPFYVPMDLGNRPDLVYKGTNFKDLGHNNATGNHPLKEAYYNRDLLYIAKELKDNLKALMDMEPVLRPPLEELGYKNLLWWS